jgi:pimeloyl-ACP methyl ester carboxylesterase
VTKIDPGETQLHQIGPQRTDREVDVVFFHGLGGDWETTWGGQKDSEAFWPRWIAEDLSEARVWSAQYPAAPIGWMGRSLGPPRVVASVLDRMFENNLGTKPIIFICHSLGGLVAKQLLRTAFDLTANNEWRGIGKAVRGIVFIATPHSGADLANYITNCTRLAGVFAWFFASQIH